MARDPKVTERLSLLISRLIAFTAEHKVKWKKQMNSSHRYAQWENNLLILGPDTAESDDTISRYLMITPMSSPNCIEIGSDDEQLGHLVIALAKSVDSITKNDPPEDAFAITDQVLDNLLG